MDVVVTGGNPQWFPFESPDQVQNPTQDEASEAPPQGVPAETRFILRVASTTQSRTFALSQDSPGHE
jgi:hypothetical protein